MRLPRTPARGLSGTPDREIRPVSLISVDGKALSMREDTTWRKPAAMIAAFLLLLSAASLLYLLSGKGRTGYTADIYQNGILIKSIYLNDIGETETFTVQGGNGCVNEIEVRPGSIAIISADCPDKLCVRQGFVSDSKLPITCLPNRLVIRLRPISDSPETGEAPDAVAY